MLTFVAEFWGFLRVEEDKVVTAMQTLHARAERSSEIEPHLAHPVRKKFWLLPVLIVMAIFGALLVLTKGSAVAPLIYTLF
jgi:hypothetical protein